MKLALSFQRQILLVFLPGREGKPFHTLSLIQNSKNLSSLLLKGKAVQGLDREQDRSPIPQYSPLSSWLHCSRSPSAEGLVIYISFRMYMSMELSEGQAVHNNKAKVMGLTPHRPISFNLFHCLTISNTSYTMVNAWYWSKGWCRKSLKMVQWIFIMKEKEKTS